jgi:hypothetical protein
MYFIKMKYYKNRIVKYFYNGYNLINWKW